MTQSPIHELITEEIKPLRINSSRSLSTSTDTSSAKVEITDTGSTEEIVEQLESSSISSKTEISNKDEAEIEGKNPVNTTTDESIQTEPLSSESSSFPYIDGLPNIDIPSPTSSQFSDEQIDGLLKEVSEIKKKSPIKQQPKVESNTPTKELQETTVSPTTPSPVKQPTLVTLSPIPTRSNTPTEDLSKLRINKSTSRNTTTLPTSVSQALFSKTLKVTKIHDKTPAPRFLGMKPPSNPEQAEKIETLQKMDYELTAKIKKVQREIAYLNDLIDSASITSDLEELRKLKNAIQRLNDYLDVKNKEKYEVGMNLTRALRRRVVSGEFGEFWSNIN